MKLASLEHAIIKSALALSLLFLSSWCYAKPINLYDQPKADAKVIDTIDPSTGIVPIYTPKDNNQWMKAGDPNNGNTGWIKMSDLNAELGKSPNTFSVTQQIITSGSQPNRYQIIQLGPQQLTTEQTQNMLKKMQMQQQQAKSSMQKMMQDMSRDINDIYQMQWNLAPLDSNHPAMTFPVIMPVVIMPQQKAVAPTKPAAKTPVSAPTNTKK